MSKVAVYIGTTNGPVRIEQISNEPAPLTEVCIGRDIVALMPISEEYENFVRSGRPVERAFGPFTHPSFRMDLSDAIKSGQSWRLAVFIAHGLLRESRLAKVGEVADHVVWLTGRVDADFQVEPVGHIEEKLYASADLFADCRAQGQAVSVFLPAQDQWAGDVEKGTCLVSASTVFDVLSALNIRTNDIGALVVPTKESRKSGRPGLGLIAAVLFGVGLAAAGNSEQGRAWLASLNESETPVVKPVEVKPVVEPTPIVEPAVPVSSGITISERRAPAGSTCASVQFGGKQARLVPLEAPVAETAKSKDLCGLHFTFKGSDNEGPFTARLDVLSGEYVGYRGTVKEQRFSDQTSFDIDLPRRMKEALRYEVSITGSGAPVSLSHSVSVEP